MNKGFDIYNPASWVYADSTPMKYLGEKLINPTTENVFSQEDVALILNHVIVEKGLKFTNDKNFRDFVNKSLAVLLDETYKFKDELFRKKKDGYKPFSLLDYSTWENCKTPNSHIECYGKTILKAGDYQPMTVADFMSLMNSMFSFVKSKSLTLEEKNKAINHMLEEFYKYQTDIKKMKKSKERAKKEDEKENEKYGIIPSEMSGIIISGHELTAAQYTFFELYQLSEKDRKTIVETWYDGRKNGLRSYQIKQDLFMKLRNIDLDFLVYLMKAEFLFDEVSIFVDCLIDRVNESETVEEVEKIFEYDYFKKHPEIKKQVLENNISFGMKNNKIFRLND